MESSDSFVEKLFKSLFLLSLEGKKTQGLDESFLLRLLEIKLGDFGCVRGRRDLSGCSDAARSLSGKGTDRNQHPTGGKSDKLTLGRQADATMLVRWGEGRRQIERKWV